MSPLAGVTVSNTESSHISRELLKFKRIIHSLANITQMQIVYTKCYYIVRITLKFGREYHLIYMKDANLSCELFITVT